MRDIFVGGKHTNKQGHVFTIVEVNGCKDILVEFEDRGFRKKTTARYVRDGVVAMPTMFVGDEFKDKNGNNVKILSIDTTKRINVAWEDGTTRVCQSGALVSGELLHPKDSSRLTPSMAVGDKFTTFQGCEIIVVGYKNFKEVTVEFSEPFIFRKVFGGGNIVKGTAHNPYLPTVAGVGVTGDFDFDTKGKMYRSWMNMLTRVYVRTAGNYADVTVCESWHSLESFKSWYDNQVVEANWHLDKDLLVRGNRVYSETACLFLPAELNVFLTDRGNFRGQYPIGVTYHKGSGRLQASCSIDGVVTYLGLYDTPEAAFRVYKARKERNAKELAAQWKSRVDARAYDALMNYEVEITD